jgi:hypothetical protein
MPTIKTRTNLTLPVDLDKALNHLSKRDDVSKSAKAVQLIKIAIQIEEDEVWNSLAEARDKKGAKFISHKNAWK